jgi:hypothetical protein
MVGVKGEDFTFDVKKKKGKQESLVVMQDMVGQK